MISKRDKQLVVNALSNFKSIHGKFGNMEVLVDKAGMKHVLERHTLKYWARVGTILDHRYYPQP